MHIFEVTTQIPQTKLSMLKLISFQITKRRNSEAETIKCARIMMFKAVEVELWVDGSKNYFRPHRKVKPTLRSSRLLKIEINDFVVAKNRKQSFL